MRFAILATLIIPAVFAANGNKVQMMKAQAAEFSSLSASQIPSSSEVFTPTRDENGNYVYDLPSGIIDGISPPSPSSAPPVVKRLHARAEVSDSDVYFSQTESFEIPNISTIDIGSPYVMPYRNVPKMNKKPVAQAVHSTHSVHSSKAIHSSKAAHSSKAIHSSKAAHSSKAVHSSTSVYSSHSVPSSKAVHTAH